jgi:hypothetical protein
MILKRALALPALPKFVAWKEILGSFACPAV